jgi:adenosylhomocysteinase
VITAEHLAVMRDGAILANAGHFDVEIDVRALAAMAAAVHTVTSGRTRTPTSSATAGRVLLLAEGRVVNLVAAEGHPPEVMDLAFGIEALALARLARTTRPENPEAACPPACTTVPEDIDAEAARLVLATMGTPDRRAHPGTSGSRGRREPTATFIANGRLTWRGYQPVGSWNRSR